ncbi:hypothetical protein [Bradyrhizobium sp. LTSP885]|uniref:hypothetical protein n=1 Tax=Bradyrhizobium sp. LTSP885 TaxID=1619232 RepID=UPI0012DFF895|nr:hypothetical protein [Bradyrhizobium sp. LTSP885]
MNTASAVDSPQCQAAFSESSLFTTGLIAAFEADQGLANQICNDVNNVNTWLPSLSQTLLNELGPLNPIDFATCACSMYQGIGQLPSEAVSCIQGLICGLSELVGLGNPCQTCQQPPPLPANCTPPAACYNLQNDPSLYQTCQNILQYNTEGPNDGYFPVQEQQEPDGSWIIITGISGSGALTTCNPGQYCICPSPMTVVNVREYDPSGNSNWWYATCQCPSGTKPLKPSGPLAYVCICDSTGLPAVPPDWGQPTTPGGNNLNPTHSICPVPLTGVPCPVAGQIRVSNNTCVAPCTKPGEVMTPDGVCCDPNNVAACGQCCGPGLVPNPANGTCMPNQTTQ